MAFPSGWPYSELRMLLRMQIENYAVMDQATAEFGPGLNALTGETGSGKSIVVEALGLLLGQRADSQIVRHGAERALIAGIFSLSPEARAQLEVRLEAQGLHCDPGEDLTLRREIAANGKSRAFINDQPVSVALLREIAPILATLHSQNEALVAFAPASQLAWLDQYLEARPREKNSLPARELFAQLAQAYAAWQAARARLEEWEDRDRQRLQELDLWKFQQNELRQAAPHPGEDAALEAERLRLAHAEKIQALAQAAYAELYDHQDAALALMKNAGKRLAELARLDPRAAALPGRLETLRGELADIAETLRPWAEDAELSPGRLQEVADRLALLDRLKRKYGPELADVLQHQEALESRLAAAENAAHARAELAASLETARAAYQQLAVAASSARQRAAVPLARALIEQAAEMAMSPQLEIAVLAGPESESDWGPRGWDRVEWRGSLNPGEPARPLQEAASGGELSRLLLALQLALQMAREPKAAAARAQNAPRPEHAPRTLVFDEIDAGIGGQAAEAVGRKLHALGAHWQVLCVTHLAQIAACARHQLQVSKSVAGGRARTRLLTLEGDARVREIARMLAGDPDDPTARRHAAELLARR